MREGIATTAGDKGSRSPPEVIGDATWRSFRFTLRRLIPNYGRLALSNWPREVSYPLPPTSNIVVIQW